MDFSRHFKSKVKEVWFVVSKFLVLTCFFSAAIPWIIRLTQCSCKLPSQMLLSVLQLYLYMNGNVKSSLLSSSILASSQQRFGTKDWSLKQETSYSSVTAQVDRSSKTWSGAALNESWWLLVFPFYFLSPFSLGCTLFKIGLLLTTNQEKNENWHILKADWQF